MSRLIVLSNRVKMPDNNPMAGGLAVALQDILTGSSVIWMGWNGDIIDSSDAGEINSFSNYKQAALASSCMQGTHTETTYMTTALTTRQYQHFYCGFANNVLWPMLHEQPKLISQAPEDYAGYQDVNRLFAQQLKSIIQPDDVIWVHDYHFLSVAYHCKKLGIKNRIGFFLHIPFAPLAFWRQLAQSCELIKQLAHYDVLGTQTQQDKAHCLAVLQHYLKDSVLEDNVLEDSLAKNSLLDFLPINVLYSKQSVTRAHTASGTQLKLHLELKPQHALTINAYPIGVNVTKIQQQVSHVFPPLSLSSTQYTQRNDTVKPISQRIIAVDRIDYSKGLLERFSGYRDFLQQYPAYQNRLQLLQIACPSRLDLPTYQRLYKEVKQAVYNVNQQFSPNTDSWQAINYSEEVLSHETVMTAFCQSDLGWVNSLQDGMNLVAKEYIAAQNPDNPGVLMLSRYAGAAEQMQAAVIIDPYQPKSIIEGLNTALTMPLGERKSRYQMLLQGLQQDNLHAWQQSFLDDLYLDNLYDNKKHQTDSDSSEAVQMSGS
ncbi:alpha,alpha-trehalose-phosphate synthase (UDP-forming) [Psychrobacter sp. ANT_H3]|uniref:alpha,alpha-trehalose-phosphate synthase (UDP-forming) n=1 Tax=Psychrobacter sp. ANT_H3 TaxID=3019444 RepID=UPI0022F1B5D7|nr:trehalose-6-phosphate synthase [Psychrobacter sp. ANT_H3]MDA5132286.1 trehalose-6-phosphate synthase [Psychrobacter sp. ANT_H3]